MALLHWLRLSLTEGIGPVLTRRLIDAAGSVAAACEADAALLTTIDGIGPSRAARIAASLAASLEEAERELEKLARCVFGLICPEDASYPLLLKEIPDPPLVLYVSGALEPRDLNAVSIVGSRKCSIYGREQADRFGALLAGAGLTVVSGGARGIDSAAHRGALAASGGRTIAVLGSALDVPYPPENQSLFRQIAERGAVLSEFALGTGPVRENFPRRNRIVSGMSRGVLIIEADERSGALITARAAYEDQNRPVFALPGRVDNPLSIGPHHLIRDGATLVTKLDDIVDGLHPLPDAVTLPALVDIEQQAPSPPPKSASPPVQLSPRQQQVLAALETDFASVDQIIERTGMDAGLVMQELTFLTLKGMARRGDGTGFARKAAR